MLPPQLACLWVGALSGRLGRLGRRLVALAGTLVLALLTAALLLHWGVLCTNIRISRYINRVCIEHMSGEALGVLCEPLCVLEAIENMRCQGGAPAGRAASFSASWMGRTLDFRAPSPNSNIPLPPIYWTDEQQTKHYPTDERFKTMIKQHILQKLNLTITNAKAEQLSKLPLGEKTFFIKIQDDSKRVVEMENIWKLLQDYEYLLTVLFENRGLFPERVGTCGLLYAVEEAEPIRGTSALFSLEDTSEEWERRARLAVLILELLEKFDKAHLHLCDTELSHFGASGGRLKHLRPSAVRTGGVDCPPEEGTNDSLQVVCSRVFLGQAAGGRVLLPGLLSSRRAPPSLAALLRRCADPLAAPMSRELKRALYNTLVRRH